MVSPIQMCEIARENAYGYKLLFSHKDFFRRISNSERDINFFIPVRDRKPFFIPCLEHIRRAAERGPYKVRVVVIENATDSTYFDVTRTNDVDYVFIPASLSMSDGQFAKALCYNVGFISCPRTSWNIFHDLDILVDEDYFQKISIHLNRKPKWLQPYKGKRVQMLSASITLQIVNNPHDKITLSARGKATPSKVGCPGGSIVVPSETFLKVGGYDPEFFYGYSPEDSFFWIKLELLYREITTIIQDHFQGSANYADDPPIEVYHMVHPPASGSNPRYMFMLDILESFFQFKNEERMKIIDMKREYMKTQLD